MASCVATHIELLSIRASSRVSRSKSLRRCLRVLWFNLDREAAVSEPYGTMERTVAYLVDKPVTTSSTDRRCR